MTLEEFTKAVGTVIATMSAELWLMRLGGARLYWPGGGGWVILASVYGALILFIACLGWRVKRAEMKGDD